MRHVHCFVSQRFLNELAIFNDFWSCTHFARLWLENNKELTRCVCSLFFSRLVRRTVHKTQKNFSDG